MTFLIVQISKNILIKYNIVFCTSDILIAHLEFFL